MKVLTIWLTHKIPLHLQKSYFYAERIFSVISKVPTQCILTRLVLMCGFSVLRYII